MAVIETWLRQDLKGLVSVRSLQGQVFSLDNGGNLIGVKVTKDGQPVTLTGTVTGYCVLSDGQTVTVTGSGSSGIQNGNEAYIVLPQLVYSVPGQISIVIKLTSGSTTTTLAACTGYVYRSRTSNEVVPSGTPIPDLATLEEVISNANTATTAANTAATAAGNVNVAMSKSGKVITITATDRTGTSTSHTVTEPTLMVERENDVVTVTATDTDGQTSVQFDAVDHEDITDLMSAIAHKADCVYPTASGDIATFSDGADGMEIKALSVAIEPVQDLHGQEAPYPAGGGANILPNTYTSSTISGVTFTVNADGTVKVNGTATANVDFILISSTDLANLLTDGETYYFSGCPSGGSSSTYAMRLNILGLYDTGSGIIRKYEGSSFGNLSIRIASGYTANNVLFYPQVVKSSTAVAWTPYSNICPISGWTGAKVTRTGKNLFDPSDFLKCTGWTVENDVYSGSSSQLYSFSVRNGIGANVFKPNTQYTISFDYKSDNDRATSFRFVYADGTVSAYFNFHGLEYTRVTFSSAAGKTLQRINFGYGSTDTIYLKNVMFEEGSAPTTYEPYAGQTYEVTFPADPGTVYGGTVDAVAGTLTVTHALVDLGSLSWGKDTSVNRFNTGGLSNAKQSDTTHAKAYCSMYSLLAVGQTSQHITGFTIVSGGGLYIYDATQEGATPDEFKTHVSGQYICYELTQALAPIALTEQQITTLLGVNNIWSDTGNVSVEYPADTKMYIDNAITQAIAAALNA